MKDTIGNGSLAVGPEDGVKGEEPSLRVSEFYRNSVVLVTGGTGFIGKVLVEKLLRSFDVKKIFLLVRKKRNVPAAERLRQMLEGPIFDVIRRNVINPSALFAKVVAVETDFQQDSLVDELHRHEILQEVQIIFHVMASVRFDESLDSALETNVASAEKLYNLALQMPNLKSVVHVSTFYSNCDRSHIEEKIYDDIPFGGLKNIQNVTGLLTASEKDTLLPFILGKMPNTYVFSKKCTESMIKQRYSSLPIGIFRPPIVVPGHQEPVPGWVDSFHGATGLCSTIVTRSLLWYHGNPDTCPLLLPVDYCVAGMLTTACDVQRRYESINTDDRSGFEVPVYNFAFSDNAITWSRVIKNIGNGLPTAYQRNMSNVLTRTTTCRVICVVLTWLMLLKAYVADVIGATMGKSTRYKKVAMAIQSLADVTEYFRFNSWTVNNGNVKAMKRMLTVEDRHLLEFDVDSIDWVEYCKRFGKGIKDELNRLQQRRRQAAV